MEWMQFTTKTYFLQLELNISTTTTEQFQLHETQWLKPYIFPQLDEINNLTYSYSVNAPLSHEI